MAIQQTEYSTKAKAKVTREKKAVIVEREIEKIITKNDGIISPQMLVEEARNPKSTLHAFFDWDDTIAAQKWREKQAYDMLLAAKFVVTMNQVRNSQPRVTEEHEVRAYLPTLEKKQFKIRSDVLESPDDRSLLIERKIATLRSWCTSVCDIPELKELRKLIEEELTSFK